MPDQSSAAEEHALIQKIKEPLNALPDSAVSAAPDSEFPTVLRGYDKFAVDAYVRKTNQLVDEMQARSSPQAAVRRALERVGEEVSGILQRAHDTAESITSQSRSESEDRLEVARREAAQLTAWARARVKELDQDTDRIWAERDRIVGDARVLAQQLLDLADEAAARFPAAEPPSGDPSGAEPPGAPRAHQTASFEPVVPAPQTAASPAQEAAAREPYGTPSFDTGPGTTQPFDPLAEDDEDQAETEPELQDAGDADLPARAFDPPSDSPPSDEAAETQVLDAGETQAFETVRVRPFDPTRTQAFEPLKPQPFDAEAEASDELPGELRFTEPADDQ
jgi:uncharacterized protein YoxC